MSGFVSDLREQLVDAAEREQARRLPRLPATSPRLVLAVAATAAMAILVLLAAGALNTRVTDDGERPVATPTPEGRDLFGGTLEPDVRYHTTAFEPRLSFVVADDRWSAVDTTLPDELRLARVTRGGPEADPPRIQQLMFLRVLEVADPAVRGFLRSQVAAPPDLQQWMRDHPDLRVGPARPVNVAGVPGERFAVRVEFDRPAHVDPWCERHSQFTCTYLGPGMNWPDGSRAEITVLRVQPEPLVIVMGGMSQADVAAVERAAAPLLESLQITRR
jgi:hypothetical protein